MGRATLKPNVVTGVASSNSGRLADINIKGGVKVPGRPLSYKPVAFTYLYILSSFVHLVHLGIFANQKLLRTFSLLQARHLQSFL